MDLRTREQTCTLDFDPPGPNATSVTLVLTFTDNRVNGSALNKLKSTRFPSSALLVELALRISQETQD